MFVVADRADRYTDLGIECLVDAQPSSGPLAGLASALRHHRSQQSGDRAQGWILLVSCDQRQWQTTGTTNCAPWPMTMLEAAVYFDTQWQPLPGLYHIGLLSTLSSRLQQGQLSMHGLLAAIEARAAKVHTTQPPSAWSFNTREDLNRDIHAAFHRDPRPIADSLSSDERTDFAKAIEQQGQRCVRPRVAPDQLPFETIPVPWTKLGRFLVDSSIRPVVCWPTLPATMPCKTQLRCYRLR